MTITISTGLIEQGLSDNAPGMMRSLIHKIHGPCPDNGAGSNQTPGGRLGCGRQDGACAGWSCQDDGGRPQGGGSLWGRWDDFAPAGAARRSWAPCLHRGRFRARSLHQDSLHQPQPAGVFAEALCEIWVLAF